MKCPACGYFNMPGLAACGACGAVLNAPEPSNGSAPPLAQWSEVLPPRARQRTSAQRVEHGLGRPGRRGAQAARAAKVSAEAAQQSARDRVAAGREWWRFELVHLWLTICSWFTLSYWRSLWRENRPLIFGAASLIPGLGQVLQKRSNAGAIHFCSALALAFLAILLFGTFLGGLFLVGFLAMICFSIWDAAMCILPEAESQRARTLRPWRVALFSVTVLSSVMAVGGVAFNDRVALVRVGRDVNRTFLAGDTLLLRPLTHPIMQLRRGDIVLANVDITTYEMAICERVLGLPGDRIECRAGQIFVNDQPLSKGQGPLLIGNNTPTFSETVPADSVALWQAWAGETTEGQPSLNFADSDAIQGKVVAICGPPSRRRWIK